MMEKVLPKISVIVPIYNIAEYLPQCIKSICNQTYSRLEIILVDDGSTDECPQICDRFAVEDARIRVIHKTNGGLVSARKAGLKVAKGEYISYVDGDDWIDCQMYTKLWNKGMTADVVTFAVYEEYGNGREIELKTNTVKEGLYCQEKDRNWLYSHMLVNGNFFEMGILPFLCAKLIKKEILMLCQMAVPDSIDYAEDVACIYPCLLNARSILVTNELLYHYRVRSDSLVRLEVEGEKMQDLFQMLNKVFDIHPMKESLKQQLKYFMWHTMLLKGYTEIKHNMVLFPFTRVKKGMKVAVYGAGMFGKVIWNFCKNSNDIELAAWFDKRADIYNSQGLEVQPVEDISDCIFDVMVIAIVNSKIAKRIKDDVVHKGISQDKIDYINIETLEQVEIFI